METHQIIILLLALGYAYFSFVGYGATRAKSGSIPWRSLFFAVGGFCIGFAIFSAPSGRSDVVGAVFLALIIAPGVLICSAWFLGGLVAVLAHRNQIFRFLLFPVLLFPFAVGIWLAIEARQSTAAHTVKSGLSAVAGDGAGEI